MNVGKRITSSFNNFLVCGTNEKEDHDVVKAFVRRLVHQVRYLESKVFDIVVNGKSYKIEFKLELLPNDMKMLACLGGELSNSASYFTTFANIHKKDANDVSVKFSMDGDEHCKPFVYSDRLSHASRVVKKKEDLKGRPENTQRTLLTQWISNTLKSRQEFVPLVEEYIDMARCEPMSFEK